MDVGHPVDRYCGDQMCCWGPAGKKVPMEEEKTTIHPLWCGIYEAKPNKLFSEEQRQMVRFIRYSQAVPCAECGRRRKAHWTMLVSFKAKTMQKHMSFSLADSGKVHMPLAPVCQQHLLAPADWPVEPSKPSKPKEAKKSA